MAAKQTRRSVSLSRSVYDVLKLHCLNHRLSMSHVVETALQSFFQGGVVAGEEIDSTSEVEGDIDVDEVSEEKNAEVSFSVPVRVAIGRPEKGRPLPSMPTKKRPPGNITSF